MLQNVLCSEWILVNGPDKAISPLYLSVYLSA